VIGQQVCMSLDRLYPVVWKKQIPSSLPGLQCSIAPVIIGLFGSRLMFTDSEEHHAVSSDHSNNATNTLQFQREQDG
jgi:hypothetical protein